MSDPLTIAYYVTPHGLGHATRALEVCRHLLLSNHAVILVSGAAVGRFFVSSLSKQERALFTFRKHVLDSGALQPHAFTVDTKRSLEEYHRLAVVHRDAHLESETSWLGANSVDVVVSDVVPLPCAAAHRAGVPAICMSNFSWDFIFTEYVAQSDNAERYTEMVRQIGADYACASALLRLPGHSPMPGFRSIVDVPLVVRHPRTPAKEVRLALGISEDTKVVTFMFGAHVLALEVQEKWLPSGWVCIICSGGNDISQGSLPQNFIVAPIDAFVPDIIAASDAVIGKIGYGSVSECLAAAKPLIFVRRDHFNEEPFLRRLLQKHGAAVEIRRQDMLCGNWAAYLEKAVKMKPSYPHGCYRHATNGAEVAAQHIAAARDLAPLSASIRLEDQVVFGYVMAGVGGAPDLSTLRLDHAATLKALPLHCSIQHAANDGAFTLPDTMSFMHTLVALSELDPYRASGGAPAAAPAMAQSEDLAAATLFNWDKPITVTRAPGRLDVMGGFADYSGSLVLQLPIAQACHVALQVQAVGEQRLWKHMRKRQGAVPRPVVRIVSLHSDQANRSPTFDMDIADLLVDGTPQSYEAIQRLFKEDAATQWAAYIAGACLVLMRERQFVLTESIALLVSSDVPVGKGVSSSAAIEVATMQALNVAFDLGLAGAELASLCQKVENLVVGAPCGIMDQMTSALGCADELLAIRCQPGEVLCSIPLPPQLRFWGIDSGIQHAVAGADYGSVRIGTFMGRTIISQALQAQGEAAALSAVTSAHSQDGYLCNISPSEWLSGLEDVVPQSMTGAQFLQHYTSHHDPVTRVDPAKLYEIRRPTEHPIMENHRVQLFHQFLTSLSQSNLAKADALTRSISTVSSPPLNLETDDGHLQALGELMLMSNASYSRCRLGSSGTDLLVKLVREQMVVVPDGDGCNRVCSRPVFGAKITGGGSGGAVCVLARNDTEGEGAVRTVIEKYRLKTGYRPLIINQSSMGAMQFGHMIVHIRPTTDSEQGPTTSSPDPGC